MGNTKQKILIVGIGGVGGYFGGLLSKAYEQDDTIDIYFLARGAHLKSIQQHGLKVIRGTQEFTTRPQLTTDNPSQIGVVDFLMLCTKTYDLEAAIKSLSPCIDKTTVILPLLNGVDSTPRLKAIFPDNEVLSGCVYIISRIKAPGVVENFGNIQTLYFGTDQEHPDKYISFVELLKNANINTSYTEQIQKVIWEKFIFISATATATSYLDCTTGEILKDESKRTALIALIKEVAQVARSKKIDIADSIEEETLKKLERLPFETTSSMQRDFRQQRRTEVESLTGMVVKEGLLRKSPTPTYQKMLEELKTRTAKE
ncbi:MAG: ketopantoate reductase family protein [Flavobacteriaceae bacterium]